MSPSESAEHLEHGGLGAVLDGEGTGLFHVADDVDATHFGDADLFPAPQRHVQGGIGGINETLHRDALNQRRGRAIRTGLRAAQQDFGSGFGRQTTGARDGFQ